LYKRAVAKYGDKFFKLPKSRKHYIIMQEIMKELNLKPSKVIGTLKEIIKEAILEGDIPNEYNAAYDLMINEAKKLGLKK
jgi:hypothetical protein